MSPMPFSLSEDRWDNVTSLGPHSEHKLGNLDSSLKSSAFIGKCNYQFMVLSLVAFDKNCFIYDWLKGNKYTNLSTDHRG